MYLRDVVEEPRYSEDIDNFRRRYPAIDEIQERLTWELSRNPAVGEPLPVAPDFRVYRTPPYQDVPGFHILYSYDMHKVYLHSIEPVNEKGSGIE